jgi:hypothetical protein
LVRSWLWAHSGYSRRHGPPRALPQPISQSRYGNGPKLSERMREGGGRARRVPKQLAHQHSLGIPRCKQYLLARHQGCTSSAASESSETRRNIRVPSTNGVLQERLLVTSQCLSVCRCFLETKYKTILSLSYEWRRR